jgi:hypothetical protein
MRLVAPNLQPLALGDFAPVPSIFSLVPNVRIDLPAVSAQAAKITASIKSLRERDWRGGPWPFALARKDRQIKFTNNA